MSILGINFLLREKNIPDKVGIKFEKKKRKRLSMYPKTNIWVPKKHAHKNLSEGKKSYNSNDFYSIQ